jgi:hypothetical protein
MASVCVSGRDVVQERRGAGGGGGLGPRHFPRGLVLLITGAINVALLRAGPLEIEPGLDELPMIAAKIGSVAPVLC